MLPPIRPHTDFKFHPRITQIGCYWGDGGHTELYLLEGDGLVLIDTGVATTPAAEVAAALAAIGRSLADISLVINTHGHHDHSGGNAAVVAASGCPVWVHAEDVAITEDQRVAVDLFSAPSLRLLGQEAALAAERARAAHEPVAPVARALHDGEVLDLGGGMRWRVVHAPGHSRGCIILLWEEMGLAIAGDALPGAGSRAEGLPLIFYPDAYRQTLALAATLPIETLCLGHHYAAPGLTRESIKLGADLVGRYIAASAATAGLIEAAVASARRELATAPFATVAERALDHLRPDLPVGAVRDGVWPAGTLSTLASVYLEQTGTIA